MGAWMKRGFQLLPSLPLISKGLASKYPSDNGNNLTWRALSQHQKLSYFGYSHHHALQQGEIQLALFKLNFASYALSYLEKDDRHPVGQPLFSNLRQFLLNLANPHFHYKAGHLRLNTKGCWNLRWHLLRALMKGRFEMV